jgi:ATP-dependent Lon protease
VLARAGEQLEVLKISQEIGAKSKQKIDKQQREYLLREQLKTIQRELGEEGGTAELDEIAQAIDRPACPRTWKKKPAGSSSVSRAWRNRPASIQWFAPTSTG